MKLKLSLRSISVIATALAVIVAFFLLLLGLLFAMIIRFVGPLAIAGEALCLALIALLAFSIYSLWTRTRHSMTLITALCISATFLVGYSTVSRTSATLIPLGLSLAIAVLAVATRQHVKGKP